jgi:hypothetical protein
VSLLYWLPATTVPAKFKICTVTFEMRKCAFGTCT